MIIVEPVDAHWQRIEERRRQVDFVLGAQSRFEDPWDETILAFLEGNRGEPIKFMSVVNAVAGCCRARSKSERSWTKVQVIRRLTWLIRASLVHRFHRKYVRLAKGQEVLR